MLKSGTASRRFRLNSRSFTLNGKLPTIRTGKHSNKFQKMQLESLDTNQQSRFECRHFLLEDAHASKASSLRRSHARHDNHSCADVERAVAQARKGYP